MIIGFNHTSFTVDDIDKAVRFWTEFLGFTAESVSPRTGDWQGRVTGVPGANLMVAHLFGYGHHMEFIQYLGTPGDRADYSPATSGAAHVCLEVDDIANTWHKLIAAGATAQGEPVAIDTGRMRCKAGYIRDPNGIIIELLEIAA